MASEKKEESVGPLVVCGPYGDPLDMADSTSVPLMGDVHTVQRLDGEQEMQANTQQQERNGQQAEGISVSRHGQEADTLCRHEELEAILRERQKRARETGSYSGVISEGDEIRDFDPPSDPSYGRRLL